MPLNRLNEYFHYNRYGMIQKEAIFRPFFVKNWHKTANFQNFQKSILNNLNMLFDTQLDFEELSSVLAKIFVPHEVGQFRKLRLLIKIVILKHSFIIKIFWVQILFVEPSKATIHVDL